jgi:hypothetical protein
MVFATCEPKKKKARNSKKAAHMTALPGDKTLVETTVAIAFAES